LPSAQETGAAKLASIAKEAALKVVKRSRRPLAVTENGLRQFVEHEETGTRLYMQNTVATFSLGCQPDLEHITSRVRNVEFNPRRFSAAIVRMKDPKCTGLVFTSGKCVVAGARHEEDAFLGARKLSAMLRLTGYDVRFQNFKVQNMVGTGDLGFPVRLEAVVDANRVQSMYEPELFPGLIYRMQNPKASVTLFVSGKVIITSVKSRSQMLEAFGHIHSIVYPHRKVPLGMEELQGGAMVASSQQPSSSSSSLQAASLPALPADGADATKSSSSSKPSSNAGNDALWDLVGIGGDDEDEEVEVDDEDGGDGIGGFGSGIGRRGESASAVGAGFVDDEEDVDDEDDDDIGFGIGLRTT